METFNSVAAFKRAMTPGSVWRATHEYIGDNPTAPSDLGTRTCEVAQSNSFALRDASKPRPSWCDWPKASEFTSPAPGVAVITKPGFVRLTYSLVSEA